MKLFGTIEVDEDLVNKKYVDDAIIENAEAFVAVYEQTSYADVIAAIGANKVILLDMPANNNLFNITYATYTNGGNAIMHTIYKSNDRPTLMTATLTPADNWTIAHTDLQDRLVSGTNIKTINNQSLLGSGNIDVSGGGGSDFVELINGVSTYQETLDAVSSNKRILFKPSKYNTSRYLVLTASANNNKVNLNIITSIANNINKFIECLTYTVDTSNQWSFVSTGYIRSMDVDSAMSDTSENAVQNKAIKSYVDTADTALQTQLGDLAALTTDVKTNLVGAINEVYEKSGEPFRVKNWANTMTVEIPACTEDLSNTAIPKMVFSIDATEGEDYQIVGMIAYEVFDAASGGNRINCWPVCQFTGNGQKELSVRWVCAGTSRKTARRINAWVLLKHR